ncbi:MAG TPA: ABC transporter substrate-binding protein [Catenuloplanes sp.]
MRKTLITALTAGLLASSLAACGDGGGNTASAPKDDGKITLGFAQVGAESGWRAANTKSIQDAAAKEGIQLDFVDGKNQQEIQISAIRTFIQKKVDVIAFSPKEVTGWDGILKEAKDAGIPVVLTDRAVDSPDKSLYVSFLGSDFVEEGKKAGQWLLQDSQAATGPVNIVELQGSTGSAPAIDRKKGFADVIAADPKFKVIASQTGEFTKAKGKEVMAAFLTAHKDIDVVYAHNDDMVLGAIEAIEEAGKKPGTEIKMITVDGIKPAFEAMAAKKINVIVECNPLLGPQLMEIVKKVVAKQPVEARILTKEGVFTQEQAAAELPNRQY